MLLTEPGGLSLALKANFALQPARKKRLHSCPSTWVFRKFLEERSREARAELEDFDRRRRERLAEQRRLWQQQEQEQQREKEKER